MSEYDVVIIGGGAAGLSAALVLSRARRRVAVVDAGAPRNAPAAHMHGFLSRDGLPPHDLLAIGRTEVESYGGRLIDGRVTGMPGDAARASTSRLADGAALTRPPHPDRHRPARRTPGHPRRPRTLGTGPTALPLLPRLRGPRPADRRAGRNPGRRRARPAHPAVVRRRHPLAAHRHPDRRPAPAAGRPGHRRRRRPGAPARRDRRPAERRRTRRRSASIPRAAVFVRPTLHSQQRFARRPGLRLDDRGWVVADATGRTTVPGVWVAGNAANPRAQVITAAGEGSPPPSRSTRTWSTKTSSAPFTPSAQGALEHVQRTHDRQAPAVPPPSKHQLALMIWLAVVPHPYRPQPGAGRLRSTDCPSS